MMGERTHACLRSLGKYSEPLYLTMINLIRPWYMSPSCMGSLRDYVIWSLRVVAY